MSMKVINIYNNNLLDVKINDNNPTIQCLELKLRKKNQETEQIMRQPFKGTNLSQRLDPKKKRKKKDLKRSKKSRSFHKIYNLYIISILYKKYDEIIR